MRKTMVLRQRSLALVALAAVLWGHQLWAGNTGKIAGMVVDKQTKEPLMACNVMVRGTTLGAATDAKGMYYILQVPPGRYEVAASYIGYHTKTVANVEVKVDLTTRVNFELEPTAIEFPELVVVAEEPLVQLDITSTRKTTSREQIEQTPGFERTTDLFLLQGGAVIDAAPQAIRFGDGTRLQVRDESVKDIHVRGGRGGEILFMVDGVPVTHPIYGGRDVLNLNVVDIKQMELLTGAFNAEYGQAQSGVVNITTRSGGQRLEGGVEYKSSEMFNTYATDYGSFYFGGPEPVSRLLAARGLRLPGTLSFFLSGNGTLSDTPYNNHRKRDDINVLGLRIREKQDNDGNFNAKIGWQLTQQLDLGFSYHGSWKSWSSFDWLWKNYPDHTAEYARNNQNLMLRVNHTLSPATFYTVNLGYLTVDYTGSLDGKSPADFWRFYKDGVEYDYYTYVRNFSGAPDSLKSTIKAPTTDGYGFFDAQSYENIWRDDHTKTLTVKADITSQIHPEHLVKTGFLVQSNDIHYVDIQDGGVKLSNYGQYVFKNEPPFPAPNGPYKEFGQNRWVFTAYPTSGGWYIQDKFEKGSLIINAGVRADWLRLGSTVENKAWKKAWEEATGLRANWKQLKYKISPRFGISFPISDRTVIFFSYGHFNQFPELQYLYRDPYTGGFTGNPFLDFEQTILYEFGFTHQFLSDWAIDVKSYTKDISKQVETTQLLAALGLPVYLYDNKGYARARGLEFELVKRYSHFTSGKLNYTVQWATGYSSSAFENYIRSLTDFPLPIRERRLGWDVRHQFILQAMLEAPPKKNPKMFGLKLPDNWNVTILSRVSSGQPYTPFTLDPVVAQKTENSASGPWTMSTDAKIRKSFNFGPARLSLFVDIFNLFGEKNTQISYAFNTLTGKPYKYGDVDPQLTAINVYQYLSWHKIYSLMDPRQFSTGRHVKIGTSIDWSLD
ncbi:MAG: TonB-dependent receptor [bacterium]|nr:TonB-dependent receptor [candidate division KSB1 bacterium]MDH7559454.1 TonB-dependent receptor [bacterium]